MHFGDKLINCTNCISLSVERLQPLPLSLPVQKPRQICKSYFVRYFERYGRLCRFRKECSILSWARGVQSTGRNCGQRGDFQSEQKAEFQNRGTFSAERDFGILERWKQESEKRPKNIKQEFSLRTSLSFESLTFFCNSGMDWVR